MRSFLHGFSCMAWRGIRHSGFRVNKSDFILTRFRVQSFSARRAQAPRLPKVNLVPSMDKESDAFYVVRKGDIIGIYKSLSDCQAQVSPSVCDPAVSVYKGYSLPKETEKYLASRGLKDALYCMPAVDLKEDIFGTIVPCPFQEPDGPDILVEKSPKKTSIHKQSASLQPDGPDILVDKSLKKASTNKQSAEMATSSQPDGPDTLVDKSLKKASTNKQSAEMATSSMSCILEFDGASKGNPGKAGAGAILRSEDGSIIARIREGLGVVTNNVAEYRALLLGLKYALSKGFNQIRVQGDSNLVCMQVNESWKPKKQNMVELCMEVKALKEKFLSFKISHVKREFNSEADGEANMAIDLTVGQVYEECG